MWSTKIKDAKLLHITTIPIENSLHTIPEGRESSSPLSFKWISISNKPFFPLLFHWKGLQQSVVLAGCWALLADCSIAGLPRHGDCFAS